MEENPQNKRRRLIQETCFCSEVPSSSHGHMHCPCVLCQGKAVSRSTAFNHCRNESMFFQDNQNEFEEQENTNVRDDATEISDNESRENNRLDDTTDSIERSADEENCETDVIRAVLEAFEINDDAKGSQSHFLKILEFGKRCYCKGNLLLERLWPTSWYKYLKLLERIDYTEPTPYLPCLSDAHRCQWQLLQNMNDQCSLCSAAPDITLCFYYLDLKSKLKKWFSSQTMCEKMLAHWREKDHWYRLNPEDHYACIKEIWDGKRFREISYFFDPDHEFLLPSFCRSCKAVVPVEIIQSGIVNSRKSFVKCPHCLLEEHISCRYSYGNPRNIVLIGHFDGWQYTNPEVHGGGSIEISIGNLEKRERNKIDQIYVSTFIPVGQLPRSKPYKFDPYLNPLIQELEYLYIEGLEIDYPFTFEDVEAGKTIIRCFLILWTGDLPAQCEVGKFIFAGKKACRRDNLTGQLDDTSKRYYYGNNRQAFRHRLQARDIHADLQTILDIENEQRSSIRAEKSKESGYTGLSLLHRLYYTYKFNVSKDLVFDEMHNLPLNVVRKQIERLVIETGLSEEQVDNNIALINWIAELKDGRYPKSFSARRSFWKAEEYQKFAYPLMEVCLGGLIPEKDFHVLQLIARMVEMTFHFRNGWYADDVNLFRKIAERFLILLEEWFGRKQCVITSHNLLHISEDVERFGLVDNYWCWPYERCVSKYIKITSNFKAVELSFARSECRREAVKFSSKLHNDPTFSFDIQRFAARNMDSAQHLVKLHDDIPSGILIGSLSANEKLLELRDKELIEEKLGATFDGRASYYKKIYMQNQGFNGVVYRITIGDYGILRKTPTKERVCEILHFISIQCGEDYKTLIHVKAFKYRQKNFNDVYSGYRRLNKNEFQVYFVYPMLLHRKVMIKTDEDGDIVIDLFRPSIPLKVDDISVPPYVEINDFVEIICENDSHLYGRVTHSDPNLKSAKVVMYEKIGEEKRWRICVTDRQQVVHWDSITAIKNGTFNAALSQFSESGTMH